MKLEIAGVDVWRDVNVTELVHDSYAEGRADRLLVRFADPKGLWPGWGLTVGTEISADGTGKMFVHACRAENGAYTVRAYAAPPDIKERRSKSWAQVHLFQLAAEVAARNALAPDFSQAADRLYSYKAQENETDLAFLASLCRLEGDGLLVYDGRLVMYDEHRIEQTEPAETVEIGADGVFTIEDRRGAGYGSAKVSAGSVSGLFIAPAPYSARVLFPDGDRLYATSNAEAARYARGLLRNANKGLLAGSFRRKYSPEICAGSMVRLSIERAPVYNGPVFITHARHDLIRNVSLIDFRKPLEGY